MSKFNFFQKVNVVSTSFGPTTAIVSFGFISMGLALLNESDDPDAIIEYSFDGATVHGDLTPFLPSEGIIFDNRSESKIWFRMKNSGKEASVRVEAWK